MASSCQFLLQKVIMMVSTCFAETSGKAGFNVETCCLPIYCPKDLCPAPWHVLAGASGANETKWKDKGMAQSPSWGLVPGDVGLVGSSPEDCCEERLCATHRCSPGATSCLERSASCEPLNR